MSESIIDKARRFVVSAYEGSQSRSWTGEERRHVAGVSPTGTERRSAAHTSAQFGGTERRHVAGVSPTGTERRVAAPAEGDLGAEYESRTIGQ